MLFQFLGADPRDYFTVGRVLPGQRVEFDDIGPPDDGCWKAEPGPTPAPPSPPAPARPAQED
jgi:hypothetical protein